MSIYQLNEATALLERVAKRIIQGPDRNTVEACLIVLLRTKEDRVPAIVNDATPYFNSEIFNSVIDTLARKQKQDILLKLLQTTNDLSPDKSTYIITVIGDMKVPFGRPVLSNLVEVAKKNSFDENLRVVVVTAMDKAKENELTDKATDEAIQLTLLKYISDSKEHVRVRRSAVRALKWFAREEIVLHTLRELALNQGEDDDVRDTARSILPSQNPYE